MSLSYLDELYGEPAPSHYPSYYHPSDTVSPSIPTSPSPAMVPGYHSSPSYDPQPQHHHQHQHQQYEDSSGSGGRPSFGDDSPFTLPAMSADAPSTFPSLAADDDGSASFSSATPTSDLPSYASFPGRAPSAFALSGGSAAVGAAFPSQPSRATGVSAIRGSGSSCGRDSSSSSSASSAASHRSTSPPASREPVKKRRVRGLNSEQRLERRRAQHRAVDANRRQKENEAIDRLHRLLRQQQQRQDGAGVEGEVADETADLEDESTSGADGGGSRKAGRLTVLESSIAMIQQLAAACKHMEAACNAKDAQLSRVSSHLHSVAASIAHQAATTTVTNDSFGFDDLDAQPFSYASYPSSSSSSPPPYSALPSGPAHLVDSSSSSTFLSALPASTSSYLSYSDRSHTLRRSGLAFASALCVAVIAVSNGVILDVNDRLLACTAWRRSDLLGTSMDKEDVAGGHPISPFMTRPRRGRSFEYLPQYPAAMQQIEGLVRGETRKAECLWRCRMGDGTIFECGTTMWGERDDTQDSEPDQQRAQYGLVEKDEGAYCFDVVPAPAAASVSGRQVGSPDRLVLVFAMEDAVVIEKLEQWSISDD